MSQDHRRQQQLAHLARLRDRADSMTPQATAEAPATFYAERLDDAPRGLSQGQYRVTTTCVPGHAPDGTQAYVKTVTLPPDLDPRAEARELQRIADQYRIGVALGVHDNHVELLDHTEAEPGVHQFFYSVAPGETLETHVEAGSLTLEDVWNVAEGVASGLAYAHDPNRDGTFNDPIIHGDVTPGNVLYDGGIATLIDHGASVEQTEASGRYTTRLFTPGFAAPEVTAGEGTIRSDVFGLGMLLAYVVTGRKPSSFFDYRNDLQRAELESAVRLRTRDTRVIDLIERCTQANPAARPTAQAVVDYARASREAAAVQASLDEAVSGVPSGLREEWNVPVYEAAAFARAIVGGNSQLDEANNWQGIKVSRPYNRDEDKVIVLQDFLDTQPVSARDRVVIEGTIERIRAQQDNRDIVGYINAFARANPERMFGLSRSQLVQLYGDARNVDTRRSRYNWLDARDDPQFRTFIETVAQLDITAGQITRLFYNIKHGSKSGYRDEGMVQDHDHVAAYLDQIESGQLDERVERLRARYTDNQEVSQALEDTRYLAMFMVLEDEGLEFGSGEQDGTFSVYLGRKHEKQFAKGLPKTRFRSSSRSDTRVFSHYAFNTVGAGILGGLAAAAYGVAVYALDLDPAVAIHIPRDATTFDIVSQYVVSHGITGGYTAAAVGAVSSFITDMAARWRSRKQFFGRVTRRYDPTPLLSTVQDLLVSTQGVDPAAVLAEVEEVSRTTNRNLTPVDLVSTVKEILGPTEE